MTNWARHPNGDIATGPLMGWAANIGPMTGFLRLETAMTPKQLQKGQLPFVQLAMTVPQMRELADLLLRMSEAVEAQPLGAKQ